MADRLPGRVKAMVYLDAFLPEHGQSLMQLLDAALPPEVAQAFIGGFRGSAQTDHTGMMAPIPAEVFNVAEANRAWVNRRCMPQALATFEMPVLLSGGGLATVGQRVYVLADGRDPSPFRHVAKQCEGRAGWSVVTLPCSHDVMVDMPRELADVLAGLA